MTGRPSLDVKPAEVQAMCVIVRFAVAFPPSGICGATVEDVERIMQRGRNNVQRWLQRLTRLGLLRIVGRCGVRRIYAPAPAWDPFSCELDLLGLLVGFCEEPGCDILAEPFRFAGRYLCRGHLMTTEGTHDDHLDLDSFLDDDD